MISVGVISDRLPKVATVIYFSVAHDKARPGDWPFCFFAYDGDAANRSLIKTVVDANRIGTTTTPSYLGGLVMRMLLLRRHIIVYDAIIEYFRIAQFPNMSPARCGFAYCQRYGYNADTTSDREWAGANVEGYSQCFSMYARCRRCMGSRSRSRLAERFPLEEVKGACRIGKA